MIRRFVAKDPCGWDEMLLYLLFAYREVPQESTGFSPFELMYGWKVRGPLDVIKEVWSGSVSGPQNVVSHVVKYEIWLIYQGKLWKRLKGRKNCGMINRLAVASLNQELQSYCCCHRVAMRLKVKWLGSCTVTRKVDPVDCVWYRNGR